MCPLATIRSSFRSRTGCRCRLPRSGEALAECARAVGREGDGARTELAPRPAQREDPIEDRSAEGSAEMVSALAPVEADAADGAPRLRQAIEIDAEVGEEGFSIGRDR